MTLIHEAFKFNIAIYPNPATDVINIHSDVISDLSVDPSGILLYRSKGMSQIDLFFLTNGLYFLEFIHQPSGRKVIKKLVMNR
jgi:hypothetical protein